MLKPLRFLAAAAALTLAFAGCQKDAAVTPNDHNGSTATDVVVAKNAHVITAAANAHVIAMTEDALVFTTGTEVDGLKAGDVIVADRFQNTAVNAEGGYLREITKVEKNGTTVRLATKQATITQVVENGTLKFSRKVTPADVVGGSITDRSSVFHTNLSQVLYDADGNAATTYDQIRADGSLDLDMTFNFNMNVSGSSVSQFECSVTSVNTADLKLTAGGALPALHKEVVLYTYYLNPITVWFGFIPIPIASQAIQIKLGVDGQVFAQVVSEAKDVYSLQTGVRYQNSAWSPIFNQSNTFTLMPFQFHGNASIEPYIIAQYTLSPYALPSSEAVLGARASVVGTATVNANPSIRTLNYDIKWGARIFAGVKLAFLGITLYTYNHDFYNQYFPITSGSASF